MRMPLTFKCPMCDQWVYKFMCFAGYVHVVLLQSSISIYLYNFIYRYMPLSLSLSVFSLVSIMTKPKSHKTSPFRPLRLEAMACTLASSKSCRASGQTGFQMLSGQHNIHHHTSTHRNSRSLSCQHFASRQRPLVFIFIHFPTLYT